LKRVDCDQAIVTVTERLRTWRAGLLITGTERRATGYVLPAA
jgi:hypothetical protein